MADSEEVMCDSCGCEPFKYRCPGCSRRSCSLSCVKRHKVEHGCSGSRSKTTFVPLHQFSDNLLYSDYYFLEEVGRCVDIAHRDRLHRQRQLRDSKGAEQRFHWLKRAAAQRGIKLHYLAQGMSLHRSNTSRTRRVIDGQTNPKTANESFEIHWCIQLHFPQAEMNYQDDNVAESTMLGDLLDRYIHPTMSDPIVRHQLGQYVRAANSVHVVMKDNDQPTFHRYHQLNKQLTLRENFVGKTIIEYPRLVVVLESHLAEYCLLVGHQTEEKERERLAREQEREALTYYYTTTEHTLHHGHEQVICGASVGELEGEHHTSSSCRGDCSARGNETSALKLIAQYSSDTDEECCT